jgi:hypothetical protein
VLTPTQATGTPALPTGVTPGCAERRPLRHGGLPAASCVRQHGPLPGDGAGALSSSVATGPAFLSGPRDVSDADEFAEPGEPRWEPSGDLRDLPRADRDRCAARPAPSATPGRRRRFA